MSFRYELIIPILVSIIIVIGVVLFFRYYGAFKHYWIVWLLMLLSAIIPFTMVIGILPFDIGMSFYDKETNYKWLKDLLEVLYWVSFVFTWVINPIIVSYLRYPYSLTLKHRIWLTIRENLIFWGTVVGVIVVGVIVLIASGNLTFPNLIPLAIALANGYGLLMLCLCLGHGFVALPRTIWLLANPGTAYLYYLQKISKETKLCASTIADGDEALRLCRVATTNLRSDLKKLYNEVGVQRMKKLSDLKDELPIPKRYQNGKSTSKTIKKLSGLNWQYLSESQLEDFFSLLDTTTRNIEETTSYVMKASEQALNALRRYNSDYSTAMVVLKRIGAVLIALLNGLCLWSELCLMINPKYSLFNYISHLEMLPAIHILCISTPILAYLMFIGSWSLKHLRLGSFFRFIAGKTNANTLNYFSIILSRLGPTIGYHYMQQIQSYDSQFQKVMGTMNVVVFVGDKWNIYSPILLVLIMFLVGFNVLNKIAGCCGKKRYTFDPSMMDFDDLENGEEVLCEMQSDVHLLIDAGLKYNVIVNKEKPTFKKSTGFKRKKNFAGLDDTPLNQLSEY
ncbi:hypothetical protein TRFO_27024 [Tritrichomonas foetus]|uniref:LMBR1-like conserved region family protein n=1 Tax=Tritrichomonas foetus TaxID=1144522 RepID=A0A1J4K1K6_9EUKA|nr:hypothetical protein TRFO_27024 [Tritrichomonas foetus]|eukprot:OHT05271.1 hypothetical protein TRFO_27024 [Tritrichomonas foetus]